LGLDAAVLPPIDGASGGVAAVVRARYPLLTGAFLRQTLKTQIAAGTRVMLPVVDPAVSNGAGGATLAARIFSVEAHLNLASADPDARWEAGLSAGVALAWLRTSGRAQAPFTGRHDDVATALPLVSMEIARRLGTQLRLRAGALVGVAAPDIKVRFAGVPVSTWGRPVVALSLGVDLAL
jgi:hypothetical protein